MDVRAIMIAGISDFVLATISTILKEYVFGEVVMIFRSPLKIAIYSVTIIAALMRQIFCLRSEGRRYHA